MIWLLALAVVLILLESRGRGAVPGSLRQGVATGQSGAALTRQELETFDKAAYKMGLLTSAAKAEALKELVTEKPALGSFLGFTPQTVDYLTLPREKYDSLYAFNPPGSENGSSQSA